MLDSDRLAVDAFIARAREKKGKGSPAKTQNEPTEAQKREYRNTRLREFRRLCVTGADIFKNELSGDVEDRDAADALNIEPIRVKTFNDGFNPDELFEEARLIYRRSNYPELAPRLARQVVRHFEIEEN